MQFLNVSLNKAHDILKHRDAALTRPQIGTAVYAWDGDGFTSLIYRGILTEVRETTKIVDGNVKTTTTFVVADEFNNDSYSTFDNVVKLHKSFEGRKVCNEDFIGYIVGKLGNGDLIVDSPNGCTIYVKPEDVIDFDWEKIKVACAKTND